MNPEDKTNDSRDFFYSVKACVFMLFKSNCLLQL